MFTKEGPHKVVIGEVVFAEAKFAKDDPNAFDICIRVTSKDSEAETDWARLEMSSNYGKGNFSTRTQAQIAGETLAALGFEGDDLTTIGEQLTGKDAIVHIKASRPQADGKVFYNVSYFVTGGNDPVAITAETVKARLAALMGKATTAPAATSTPAASKPATMNANPVKPVAATDAFSPFVKCSKCNKGGARKSTQLCKNCE